jgi:hypothetical protein
MEALLRYGTESLDLPDEVRKKMAKRRQEISDYYSINPTPKRLKSQDGHYSEGSPSKRHQSAFVDSRDSDIEIVERFEIQGSDDDEDQGVQALKVTGHDFSHECIKLQKLIARCAKQIVYSCSQFPSVKELQHSIEKDAQLREIIGEGDLPSDVEPADLVQAFVGAYIWTRFLVTHRSCISEATAAQERTFETWLSKMFGAREQSFIVPRGLLRWILDEALKVSFLKQTGMFVLMWPRPGELFNKDWMATWDPPAKGSQSVAIALTFAVQEKITAVRGDYDVGDGIDDDATDEDATDEDATDEDANEEEEEEEEEEGDRDRTYWPATVIIPKGRRKAKPTLANQIRKLKHLMTSMGKGWLPIQASALLEKEEWTGCPLE